MSDERMQILEMISNGTITAAQASQLIQALEAGEADFSDEAPLSATVEPDAVEEEADGDLAPPQRAGFTGSQDDSREDPLEDDFPEPPMGFKQWQSFWLIPLAVGILITMVSGLLLYAGVQAGWNGFWMFCIWLPLLLGITVLGFGAMSRTARWLHVRVNTGQDEWPRRVAISLPLPLRTSAWVMRVFGHTIPGLADLPISIDEAIEALQDSLTPDDPLYIRVDESGGKKVEVFIG